MKESEGIKILRHLVTLIETCDSCDGDGKGPCRQDACRNCGGVGEVLRPSAIEAATDARDLLARLDAACAVTA